MCITSWVIVSNGSQLVVSADGPRALAETRLQQHSSRAAASSSSRKSSGKNSSNSYSTCN